MAKLFADASTIVLTAFISPYRADRNTARALHAVASQPGPTASQSQQQHDDADDDPLQFIEVFVDISLEEAEKRDPKGLYKRARAGEIKDFTGISAPYEAPEAAEITIDSARTSVEDAVRQIVTYLEEKGLLRTADRAAG